MRVRNESKSQMVFMESFYIALAQIQQEIQLAKSPIKTWCHVILVVLVYKKQSNN